MPFDLHLTCPFQDGMGCELRTVVTDNHEGFAMSFHQSSEFPPQNVAQTAVSKTTPPGPLAPTDVGTGQQHPLWWGHTARHVGQERRHSVHSLPEPPEWAGPPATKL
jgi:hypothetical protein